MQNFGVTNKEYYVMVFSVVSMPKTNIGIAGLHEN